jgi:hypothetical protein
VGGWIAQYAGDANEQANCGDLLVSVHDCAPSLSPVRPHWDRRLRIFLAEVNRDFRNSGGSGVFSTLS